MDESAEVRAGPERELGLVVDRAVCGGGATTVIDMALDPREILRSGSGDPAKLGLLPAE